MHTRNHCRFEAIFLVLPLCCAALLVGCGGGDESDIARFVATLSGMQETPAAVNTTATGTGIVTLFGTTPATNEQINVVTNTTNLIPANVTAAHIHVRSGLNPSGPVILTLYTTADGAYTGQLGESFLSTSTDFTPNAGVGVNTWQDFIAAILEGRAYINFHTSDGVPPTNTGAGDMASGEIRGIIGAEDFAADMNGANERPTPVVTAATGKGTVAFNFDKTRIDTVVTFTGIVPGDVTMAHIHEGGPNAAGGPIFTLYNRATDGALAAAGFARNVTAADFTASGTVTNFQQALNAIRTGSAYINVHTDAHAGGEIRGQLAPIP